MSWQNGGRVKQEQNGIGDALADFQRLHDLPDDSRGSEQTRLVSRFYDVVTRFYEFGWGNTFHFSPRRPRETLAESQRRHDEEIGALLNLVPGMQVADFGCGVGGPALTIAAATGATVTGINYNAHQIERGNTRAKQAGLAETCKFLYADYMCVPLPDGSFDAAYSFEAFCHAPDRQRAFGELYRLLKPGGEAAIVDWCFTDMFDAADAHHADLRVRIEENNAVPNLPTAKEYVAAMEGAGFEVVRAVDQQVEQGNAATPWFMALEGRDWSLSSMARIPAGRAVTAGVTRALEALRIAPRGTSETARFLNVAADALVEAGKLGIFTPSLLVHARKRQA